MATIQMSHDVIDKKDSNINSQSAKWQDLENLTLNDEISQNDKDVAAIQVFHDVTDKKNSNPNFQLAMLQDLENLIVNYETLKNDANFPTISEQVLGDAFSSFMERMEKHLFSKNILYPLVKKVSDEYPAWFEDHKKALSLSDLERYTKQLELIQKVCAVLEQEKKDDTKDIKQYRFEHVKQLMTEMQNYGQVPEDLIKENSSFSSLFQYDSEENLLPLEEISRQDCCIM